MSNMTTEIELRSAAMALERVHVLGSDADLMAGALCAVRRAIKAIEEAKKEASSHDDQNEGQNV